MFIVDWNGWDAVAAILHAVFAAVAALWIFLAGVAPDGRQRRPDLDANYARSRLDP